MNLYTRKHRSSVTRYNTETWDLQARIITAGGTISASSLAAVDVFITSCKATGIWASLVDVGLFVGDQLAAALVKVKYPVGGQSTLTNHNFVGGDYTERGANGGLNGDGATKYLQAGTIQDVSGDANSTQALAFYSRAAANNAANYSMLGCGVGNALMTLRHTNAPADDFTFLNGDVNIGQNNSAGFYLGNASGTAIRQMFFNGGLIATGGGLFGNGFPDNTEFYIFARNNGGVAADFWSGRASFYGLCNFLTPAGVGNLYSAVQQLQQTLNRNV